MNYSQAKEEADRLSRMLKRDVEPAPLNCDCDYWPACPNCEGGGTKYELRYAFCNHLVTDSDEECQIGDCVHREYLATVQREEVEVV
jgi:hypothetical protein